MFQVAESHKLPVLADEIYGGIVFSDSDFFPVASLTNSVPVLSVGGIAKEFLVPGFRVRRICLWLILRPLLDTLLRK